MACNYRLPQLTYPRRYPHNPPTLRVCHLRLPTLRFTSCLPYDFPQLLQAMEPGKWPQRRREGEERKKRKKKTLRKSFKDPRELHNRLTLRRAFGSPLVPALTFCIRRGGLAPCLRLVAALTRPPLVRGLPRVPTRYRLTRTAPLRPKMP